MLNEPRADLASGVRELATMTASLMGDLNAGFGGNMVPAAVAGKAGEER